MNWQKAFTRNLIRLSIALACGTFAFGQTPLPNQRSSQQSGQQSGQPPPQPMSVQASTLSPQMPDHLAGIEADKVARWTLKDAILAALEKNVDLEIARQNVRLVQFDLSSAQGVYDPLATSTINYNSQKSPNIARFSGSAQNFLQTSTIGYNFGYSKLIESTGGSYQVNFNNSRTTSNASSLATAYNPSLTLGLTQPLMKNFRIDANRHQIQIAKKNLDLSDAQFRQNAITVIATVQQAYWELAFAIRNEEIARDAVRLAQTQLKNNQLQVDVGTLAPLDVVTAATQVETTRQQVFQAMQAVAQAEDALKALTVGSPSDDLWSAKILPVESFDPQPLALPLSDALNLALANRPEVKEFVIQKEINRIDVDFFRNQIKPQVNLIASYGISGIGGAVGYFPDQNGVLQPANVAPDFIGGYGTALGHLLSNSFRVWNVGVNISLPLHNRTAQANLGKAIETNRQLDSQTRKQLQSIEVEVRAAYHAAEAARLRADAARAAREYAEKQLAGEQYRFDAGLSTTFLILTRQNDLSQARGTEVRAQADYNKAVADLQRAISTTLSSNNIEITSDLARPGGNEKK